MKVVFPMPARRRAEDYITCLQGKPRLLADLSGAACMQPSTLHGPQVRWHVASSKTWWRSRLLVFSLIHIRLTRLANHEDLHVPVQPLRLDLRQAAEGAAHVAHIRRRVAVPVNNPRLEAGAAAAVAAALRLAAAVARTRCYPPSNLSLTEQCANLRTFICTDWVHTNAAGTARQHRRRARRLTCIYVVGLKPMSQKHIWLDCEANTQWILARHAPAAIVARAHLQDQARVLRQRHLRVPPCEAQPDWRDTAAGQWQNPVHAIAPPRTCWAGRAQTSPAIVRTRRR